MRPPLADPTEPRPRSSRRTRAPPRSTARTAAGAPPDRLASRRPAPRSNRARRGQGRRGAPPSMQAANQISGERSLRIRRSRRHPRPSTFAPARPRRPDHEPPTAPTPLPPRTQPRTRDPPRARRARLHPREPHDRRPAATPASAPEAAPRRRPAGRCDVRRRARRRLDPVRRARSARDLGHPPGFIYPLRQPARPPDVARDDGCRLRGYRLGTPFAINFSDSDAVHSDCRCIPVDRG
jgi:hypothetical protein